MLAPSPPRPRRRVLQVIWPEPYGKTGGKDQHLLDLARRLRDTPDYEPVILSLIPSHLASLAQAQGIETIDATRLDKPIGARFAHLAALPRRMDIDVVHAHGYQGNHFVYWARKVLPDLWRRIPFVVTSHGWVDSSLDKRLAFGLELMTLKEANRVIVVSEAMRERLLRRGFSADHVVTVLNGIDPNVPASASAPALPPAVAPLLQPAKTAFLVASVGRLVREKRIDRFLAACAHTAPRMPDARFLVIGSGPLEKPLQELAQRLGLAERVIFTGLMLDMPALFPLLDVVVLTSETEGTPRALLEAMAHRRPVVATAVGGVPQIVRDGYNGRLVDDPTPAAIGDAILGLYHDRALAATLGANGRTLVETTFSLAHMADRITAIYDEVIADSLREPRPRYRSKTHTGPL